MPRPSPRRSPRAPVTGVRIRQSSSGHVVYGQDRRFKRTRPMAARRHVRLIGLSILVMSTCAAGHAEAQIDLAGEWAARVHEDEGYRFGGEGGVRLGDYTGLPINDAGRRKADSWDASIQDLPERQAIPASSLYGVRGGGTNL